MASEPVRSTAVVTAPKDYNIPNAQQIRLLSVQASFIDNGAASTWIPAVQILDNNGNVLVTAADQGVTVTAGGSADVSWFPFRRGVNVAPAPSPNPLGTLFAWYDFADTSTITLDGSSNIQSIADKSGNGHLAYQVTASRRPSETTINGHNAGLFAHASSQCLVTDPFATTQAQPLTAFVVFTQDIAAGVGYFPGVIGHTPGTPVCFMFCNGPFGGRLLVQSDANGNIDTLASPPFTQQLLCGIYDGAASVARLNGVATAGALGADGVQQIALGTQNSALPTTEDDYLQGKICEVLYYTGHLSATQLAAVESYLKTKWATP